MRQLLRLSALFLLLVLSGCGQTTPSTSASSAPSPASEQVEELKKRMTTVFSALEMYASDNSLAYPESLEKLMPKYLDAIPQDPVSQKSIVYQKQETGFILSASGEYGGADKGFPQMNQDGFFALTAADFRKGEELEDQL